MEIKEGSLDTIYSFYFPAKGYTNLDVSQPKTFLIPREIIPHNFSLLDFAVSEELGNKQKDRQTHRQTDSLTDWCFYKVMTKSILLCIIMYQWLRHYTCSDFCKTSYHLLISPPPTYLPNTLKIHTGENKIDRQSRMWRQYTCYFPANGSTNPDVFQPKTFPIPRGIIPQNFSSLGFAVSEELGNIQTHKLTH